MRRLSTANLQRTCVRRTSCIKMYAYTCTLLLFVLLSVLLLQPLLLLRWHIPAPPPHLCGNSTVLPYGFISTLRAFRRAQGRGSFRWDIAREHDCGHAFATGGFKSESRGKQSIVESDGCREEGEGGGSHGDIEKAFSARLFSMVRPPAILFSYPRARGCYGRSFPGLSWGYRCDYHLGHLLVTSEPHIMPHIIMYICMAFLGSMSMEIIDVDTTTWNAAISACEKAGGKAAWQLRGST